jgi:hypothetical protein
MRLNKAEILRLIDEGYLMVNTHPDYPLMILNYSRKAQFEKYWNEYTLMARGLIIDMFYDVVAMPFKKFFNYEELIASPMYPNAPISDYEIYDKMDGSLGILFNYDGLWHIATRGSFMSDQAIRAKSILKQHDLTRLNVDNTYLFEIIYPENRIVVDYSGAEKLVLLGIMHVNGHDYEYDKVVEKMAYECPTFEIVKRYDSVADINELKSRNISNQEGYVMRLKGSDFRMKCKFEDYCRLHSIITNVSTKDIWATLRDGKSIEELLVNTPDEFDDWVRAQVCGLQKDFADIELGEKMRVDLIKSVMKDPTSKKEFAEIVLQSSGNSAVAFRMFEGKKYDHIIWRIIEPAWSKPFFQSDEAE